MRVGRFPWAVVVFLVPLAIIVREPVLILAAGLVIVAGLASEISARLAHEALRVRVRLSERHIVAGETVTVTLDVENAKPLPLTWCEVRLALPEGVEPADVTPRTARRSVAAAFVPRGNERIRLVFELRGTARGAYALGAALLRTGDWLGFFSEERDAGDLRPLVVFPRPLEARMRDVPAFRPLAERATLRGLLPDPLRFAGVREHQPRDARKDIHWKATARAGRLQTKVFEPATSGDVVFLLNVASYPSYWVQADPDAVEDVIAATTTLLRQASDEGRQFGLITNGIDALSRRMPRALLGRGPAKLRRALEMLARLSPYAGGAPHTVFLREAVHLPWGATLVCVTPIVYPTLAESLVRLRRQRHRMLVLSIQEPAAAARARLVANRIGVEALVGERRAAV